MSGPYGPNDAPGSGEGRNDPTQVWGGQQPPGAAPQWGSQQPSQPQAQQPDPQQSQATQVWGGGAPGQQQWSQPQAQQQQWGQQPEQPHGQQQWGQQPEQPQQQWGQSGSQWSQPQGQPEQQWGQQPQAQQWSQPQPQQQWGQQPHQPQQWGAQQANTGGKKKTGLFVALGLIGLAVLGGIIALVLLVFSEDQLDQGALQSGVEKVLKESYGIDDVSDVSCPSGQAVKVDSNFNCDLKVGGEAKKVSIKITKEDGTYEVGRPS